MLIYYNPECSKCQEAKGILEVNNCEFGVREYLKDPPSVAELKDLLKLLNCTPADITRKGEPLFATLIDERRLDEESWLGVLSENPILIERPIVVDGQRALVGRPPSLVLQLVKGSRT